MLVRDEVVDDLAITALPGSQHVVCAIDENSRMFVLCDVRTGTVVDAHPKNTHELFLGKAPDSQERAFAYAVSVAVVPARHE